MNLKEYSKKYTPKMEWPRYDLFNSGNIFIKPQSDSASTLIIKPFYFIQITPFNKAHFLIKINNNRGGTATYVGEANWEPECRYY